MRRSDLLALTGTSEPVFTALTHRKLLPFERRRQKGGGWTNYTGSDALALELAHVLTRYGRTQEQAAELIRERMSDIAEVGRKASESHEILFGFADVGRLESDSGDEFTAAVVMAKPRGDKLNGATFEFITDRNPEGRFHDVVLINVSQRLDELRAKAAGLPNADVLLAELDHVWEEVAK